MLASGASADPLADAWRKKHGAKGEWLIGAGLHKERHWQQQSISGDLAVFTDYEEADYIVGGWDEPKFATASLYTSDVLYKMEPAPIPGVYRISTPTVSDLALRAEDDGTFTEGRLVTNDDGLVVFEEEEWEDALDGETTEVLAEQGFDAAHEDNRDYSQVVVGGVPRAIRASSTGTVPEAEPDPDQYWDERFERAERDY